MSPRVSADLTLTHAEIPKQQSGPFPIAQWLDVLNGTQLQVTFGFVHPRVLLLCAGDRRSKIHQPHGESFSQLHQLWGHSGCWGGPIFVSMPRLSPRKTQHGFRTRTGEGGGDSGIGVPHATLPASALIHRTCPPLTAVGTTHEGRRGAVPDPYTPPPHPPLGGQNV